MTYFSVSSSIGKSGKVFDLVALHDQRAGLAFERAQAGEERLLPGAGGAVDRDVDALAGGDFLDFFEHVGLLDVDDDVGAELLRDLETPRVFRGAADDDQIGAGLFRGDDLAQTLLARALESSTFEP